MAAVTAALLAVIAGVALAAPSADFDASTRSPYVGDAITFTAENSCEVPVTCTWSFGDGGEGSGRTVSHAYDAPGEKRVTLTVTDPSDPEPGSRSRNVDVRARNRPPQARVTASTTTPAAGQSVSFDSSRSSDPDDDRLARAWDLDADGDFDDGRGTTESRSFRVGSHLVRLRVTDPAGESSTDQVRITVANGVPVAAIRASDTRPLSLASVRFTAVASDPDGSIVKREWDFDKDGYDDGTGATANWTFRVPGGADVRLRVTDDAGATKTATLAITVRNRAPKAAFSFAPIPVERGRPVAFRSRSADPEGRLDKHGWDFDGDGRFDDATGASPTKTFPAGQNRIDVGLRVTDRDGGSNVATASIVPGNRSPTVTLTASPAAPLTAESVTFSTRAQDPDGRVALYRWEVDGVATTDTGAALTTSFATSGQHTVAATVTDNAGASATATEEVDVVERAPLVFTFAPNPVIQGVPVTFTAGFTDPAVTFRALAWDLDGDGQFDDGTGTSVTTTYGTATKVFVGLNGVDPDDKPVSVYREVTVEDGSGASGTPPSANPTAARLMRPFPVVRFAGRLTARGARLTLLTVRAPKGAVIRAACRGDGCPRSRILRTARVERLKRLQTSYRAGARIVLRVTKRGRIGKYVRITIRKDKRPSRRDACVWPGVRRPRACPG